MCCMCTLKYVICCLYWSKLCIATRHSQCCISSFPYFSLDSFPSSLPSSLHPFPIHSSLPHSFPSILPPYPPSFQLSCSSLLLPFLPQKPLLLNATLLICLKQQLRWRTNWKMFDLNVGQSSSCAVSSHLVSSSTSMRVDVEI